MRSGWSPGDKERNCAAAKWKIPRIESIRIEGSNEYQWNEQDKGVRLPMEPDALFTLRFADRPPESQLAHFCYETDRGTIPMANMLKKFRAYHHFIKRQQKHKEAFGVHPIRAVLIETTKESRLGSSWNSPNTQR